MRFINLQGSFEWCVRLPTQIHKWSTADAHGIVAWIAATKTCKSQRNMVAPCEGCIRSVTKIYHVVSISKNSTTWGWGTMMHLLFLFLGSKFLLLTTLSKVSRTAKQQHMNRSFETRWSAFSNSHGSTMTTIFKIQKKYQIYHQKNSKSTNITTLTLFFRQETGVKNKHWGVNHDFSTPWLGNWILERIRSWWFFLQPLSDYQTCWKSGDETKPPLTKTTV